MWSGPTYNRPPAVTRTRCGRSAPAARPRWALAATSGAGTAPTRVGRRPGTGDGGFLPRGRKSPCIARGSTGTSVARRTRWMEDHMLTEQDARQAIGTTVYSSNGEKIGKVGQLFLDDETQRPEFITVNTGLFGTNETFIPVADAELAGDRLTVPVDKDRVKDAPNVAADGGHLDRDEEQRLYEYYGLGYGTLTAGLGGGMDTGYETGTDASLGSDVGTDSATGAAFTGGERSAGHDVSGPNTD